MGTKEEQHETPCNSLESFKKITIALMGLQVTIMLLSFGFATASYIRAGEAASQANSVLQKQIEFRQNQKILTEKTDDALAKANAAMAISAKTEANIEWIRTGQTELKTLVLNYLGVKSPAKVHP